MSNLALTLLSPDRKVFCRTESKILSLRLEPTKFLLPPLWELIDYSMSKEIFWRTILESCPRFLNTNKQLDNSNLAPPRAPPNPPLIGRPPLNLLTGLNLLLAGPDRATLPPRRPVEMELQG